MRKHQDGHANKHAIRRCKSAIFSVHELGGSGKQNCAVLARQAAEIGGQDPRTLTHLSQPPPISLPQLPSHLPTSPLLLSLLQLNQQQQPSTWTHLVHHSISPSQPSPQLHRLWASPPCASKCKKPCHLRCPCQVSPTGSPPCRPTCHWSPSLTSLGTMGLWPPSFATPARC